ncbi:MAG: hypothetical protein OER21_09530 [Gemmatimonadota bacterium]|nr:hypothetical protein [Gemmatimonadota bacterium]
MSVAAARRVRVTVTDTWDTIALEVEPGRSLADIKRDAVLQATGRPIDPAEYLLKFRGGLVLDERATVADLGLPDGAALIVLPARRHPVR